MGFASLKSGFDPPSVHQVMLYSKLLQSLSSKLSQCKEKNNRSIFLGKIQRQFLLRVSLIESTIWKLASRSIVKGDDSRTHHGTLPLTIIVTYPKKVQVICKRACTIITAPGIICGQCSLCMWWLTLNKSIRKCRAPNIKEHTSA